MNTSGYGLTVAIGWGAALVAAGECFAGGYTVEAWYPFTNGIAGDATGNGHHGGEKVHRYSGFTRLGDRQPNAQDAGTRRVDEFVVLLERG